MMREEGSLEIEQMEEECLGRWKGIVRPETAVNVKNEVRCSDIQGICKFFPA
jgi:hypothetical protein